MCIQVLLGPEKSNAWFAASVCIMPSVQAVLSEPSFCTDYSAAECALASFGLRWCCRHHGLRLSAGRICQVSCFLDEIVENG